MHVMTWLAILIGVAGVLFALVWLRRMLAEGSAKADSGRRAAEELRASDRRDCMLAEQSLNPDASRPEGSRSEPAKSLPLIGPRRRSSAAPGGFDPDLPVP